MNPLAAKFSQHRVLFLDDEESMLKAIARALREESFEREFHQRAQDALNALKRNRFTVVVSDLRMPDLGGLEFLTMVKREYPKPIRIIATGVTELSEVLKAMRSGETHRYISKPLNIEEELLPTLYQSFELYDMQRAQERLTEELVELSTHLQHQKEEIAFFKKLSDQSNTRKEALLMRFYTIYPRLLSALESLDAHAGPDSPPALQNLVELLRTNRTEMHLLETDLSAALTRLECQPADPL